MTEEILVREAVPEDAPALLEIYRPYVENTTVSFEYEVPGIEEFRGRISNTLKNYPYLAAVNGQGELMGYTYASIFHGRIAYSWSVETSIYVREGVHGQGVGKILYEGLEKLLLSQNVCNLYACIAHPNPESEVFHLKMGYHKNAHFENAGFKFGQWVDIIWMAKKLQEYPREPQPFIPYGQL